MVDYFAVVTPAGPAPIIAILRTLRNILAKETVDKAGGDVRVDR